MIDFDSDPSATRPAPPSPGSPIVWVVGLAVLICLNSFAVLSWTGLDTRPCAWDEALHTGNTFEYRDRLAAGSALFRPVYFNYPPLYNLTLVPFINRVADIADAGAFVNLFYLA